MRWPYLPMLWNIHFWQMSRSLQNTRFWLGCRYGISCCLSDSRRFEKSCRLHLQGQPFHEGRLINLERIGIRMFRNVGHILPHATTTHPHQFTFRYADFITPCITYWDIVTLQRNEDVQLASHYYVSFSVCYSCETSSVLNLMDNRSACLAIWYTCSTSRRQ